MTQEAPAQPRSFSQRRSRKGERRTAAKFFAVLCTAVTAGAIALFWLGASGWAYPVLAAVFAIGVIAIDPVLRRPGGIPCLTWHSVSADATWLPWAMNTSVRPATLDRQLGLLRRMGLQAMDTRAFCALRRQGREVPDTAVLLHFDDGYRDNLIAARPILAKHGMRATMFISLDFIAPDDDIASAIDLGEEGELGVGYEGSWAGYLSWRELKWLDREDPANAFDIQPHGVGHGRVATSERAVDVLDASNWRKLAWMQWSQMPGDKNDWYLHDAPPAVPLGTPVPESDSALTARAWTPDEGLEAVTSFESRVMNEFIACFDTFESELAKTPEIFCWPQNLATPQVRALAAEAGFVATTAGAGNNRADENPRIISRLHVGERYGGLDIAWLDDLAFVASVRAFQGNHYWYLLLIPIHGLGKIMGRLPRWASSPAPSYELTQ